MPIDDVRFLASDQFGLITTAQAENLGVSRVAIHRMMKQGELRLCRRGVYSFESSPLASHEEIRAAWMSLNPSRTVAEQIQDIEAPVICTTSAAAVLGIGDFQTEQHEFFVSSRKQSRAEDIHLRVRVLPPDDIKVVNGLKVTTPTRIVVDLLNELRELEHIGALIVDAIQMGYEVDWTRIQQECEKQSGSYEIPGKKIFSILAGAAKGSEAKSAVAQNIVFSLFPELSKQLTRNWASALAPLLKQQEELQGTLAPVLRQQQELAKTTRIVLQPYTEQRDLLANLAVFDNKLHSNKEESEH